MKNVLLVISKKAYPKRPSFAPSLPPKRINPRSTPFCGLGSGAADDASDKFTDIGFIGDKPSAQVSEAIMKDYRQRGYEELGKVQIKCMEEGVVFEPLMEQEGDFVESILSLVEGHSIALVVITGEKRSPLRRYLSKSPEDELKEKAGCEVEVFIEEDN